VPIVEHEMNVVDHDPSPYLWHKRLGHISQKSLEVLVKMKHLSNLKNTQLDLYIHCLVGKEHKVSFSKKVAPSKRTRVLELVHTDVCRPMEVQTFNGAWYFVTFIDNYSRKLWVDMIKINDHVLDCVKSFI